MPDIQINPTYATLASLTAEDVLTNYKLLAVANDVLKYLPVSLLNTDTANSGWQALAYKFESGSANGLHVITLVELTDLVFGVFTASRNPELYVLLGLADWDGATTVYPDYYKINLTTGASSAVTGGLESGGYIALRADDAAVDEVDNIARLSLSSIVYSGSMVLMIYRGEFETLTVYENIVLE